MNADGPININELIAMFGDKDTEILMLRSAAIARENMIESLTEALHTAQDKVQEYEQEEEDEGEDAG